MYVEIGGEVAAAVQEMELVDLVEHASAWQYVIHGGAVELRSAVAKILLKTVGLENAKRYALCGCGDEMKTNQKGEFHIVPRGCGERLCPRCSRKRGVKFLRKIEQHLASQPHKYIYHMVLTQQVRGREALKACAKRFEEKWRNMRARLKENGMVAGLGTIHITWSRWHGWHYHMHVLMEVESEVTATDIEMDWWGLLERVDGTRSAAPCYLRQVATPGPAMSDLAESAGETELWKEAESELGKAMQYPMRDILAGVTGWGLGEANNEQLEELMVGTKGLQSHRTYGAWRIEVDPPGEEGLEAVADTAEATLCTEGWLSLGVMDRVQRAAQDGASLCAAAMSWLEANVRNDSKFGQRVVGFCRAVVPW